MDVRPEYVELCRELRTQLEAASLFHAWLAGEVLYCPTHDHIYMSDGHADDDDVWLPRLDQLIGMLSERGVDAATFTREAENWMVSVVGRSLGGFASSFSRSALGRTPEEGALRVYLADR